MREYIYVLENFKEGSKFDVQTKTKYETLPIKTGRYLIVKIVKRTGGEVIMCLKQYSSEDYEDELYLFEAKDFNLFAGSGYIQLTN